MTRSGMDEGGVGRLVGRAPWNGIDENGPEEVHRPAAYFGNGKGRVVDSSKSVACDKEDGEAESSREVERS